MSLPTFRVTGEDKKMSKTYLLVRDEKKKVDTKKSSVRWRKLSWRVRYTRRTVTTPAKVPSQGIRHLPKALISKSPLDPSSVCKDERSFLGIPKSRPHVLSKSSLDSSSVRKDERSFLGIPEPRPLVLSNSSLDSSSVRKVSALFSESPNPAYTSSIRAARPRHMKSKNRPSTLGMTAQRGWALVCHMLQILIAIVCTYLAIRTLTAVPDANTTRVHLIPHRNASTTQTTMAAQKEARKDWQTSAYFKHLARRPCCRQPP